MQQPIRTFLGIELAAKPRARASDLIGRLRSASSANVRWVEPRNLHITLKFLDNIPARQIPDVCETVSRAVARLTRFEIELVGAGAFPETKRPRTVWIGVRDGEQQLVDVHDAVERLLADLGFREEQRRYRPHVTIGRVRRSPDGVEALGAELERHQDFECGRQMVSEVLVFASRLDRSGPSYEVMGRAVLGRQ